MRPVHVSGAALDSGAPVLQLSPRTAPEGMPSHLTRLTVAHAGRQIVMPLRRSDGTRILAILGWVPSDVDLPAAPAAAIPAAPAPLLGVLRRTAEPSVWGITSSSSSSSSSSSASSPSTPAAAGAAQSSAAQGVHAFLNTAVLAEACGMSAARGDVVDAALEVLAPFPAEAGPSPWPVTRQREQLETASLAPPYTHLIYAGTWATLAAFGGLATLRRLRGTAGRGASRRLAA